MDNEIFTKLIKGLKPSEDSTMHNQAILVSAEGNFELEIYGDFPICDLKIETFGYMDGGEWIELVPTVSQLESLTQLLSLEVERLKEDYRIEKNEEEEAHEEYLRNMHYTIL